MKNNSYKNSYLFPNYLRCLSKNFNITSPKRQKSGRNNTGQICVWQRGGGHKKNYRFLDTKNFYKTTNRLLSIEYDPNRSGFIGLFLNLDSKIMFFDLVSENQRIGEVYKQTTNVEETSIGNKMPLGNIPLGTLINSLELKPGKGSQFLRSAGCFGKLQKKNIVDNLGCIKMPSQKYIYVSLNCLGTVGFVSNVFHKNKNYCKAGRRR